MKIKQRGVILIAVLWIISISLVFISILAKNTRLSATIVMHQQQSLDNWSKMLSLINLVKMEVLLKQQPASAFGGIKGSYQADNKQKYFYGGEFKLSFSGYEDMVVRVYDLSGKLNVSNINKSKFRQILLKKSGHDEKQTDKLLDAWLDWTDRDDLKRLNGAEKDYYQKLSPAYFPRNGRLQSVNELALIKGFSDVFENYDYTQAFTLYGVKRPQVDPNIASKAVLLLIPGITLELADEIIKRRQHVPFSKISEFNALIPANIANAVKGWFGLTKSKTYAIVIYSKQTAEDAVVKEDGAMDIYVYKEIIQINSKNKIPKTLRVFPSYKITIPILDKSS